MLRKGQAKYSFIDNNIIYYPIYFVDDEKVSSQIGVYEILADQLPNIIDDDGDVDLDKVDNPLIYSFVTENTIKKTPSKNINSSKSVTKTEINEKEDSEEEGGEEEDSEEEDSEEEDGEEEDSGEDSGEEDSEKDKTN